MENKRFFKFLIGAQLIFVVAQLVFVAFQFSNKYEGAFTVRTELCAMAPVDFGVWGGQLRVQHTDLFHAQEEMERNRERIIRNFTAKGILASDVEFSNILTQRDTNVVVLTQNITVRTRDIERLKKVASESGELLKFKIDFSAQEPKYHIANFSAWLLEQLPALLSNARKQAEALLEKGQVIKSIERFNMAPLSSMSYQECEQAENNPGAHVIHIFLEAEIEFSLR
jgi:hypothetical protein